MFSLKECEGVSVSGTQVDLPHFRRTVVDSGTTLIIVSLDSFLSLKRYFQAHYCSVSGLCGEDGDPNLSWFDPVSEKEFFFEACIETHCFDRITVYY